MKNRYLYFIIFIYPLFFKPSLSYSQSKNPNIIFILTDDHRWDALGYAGNTIIQTPVMDDLARKGTYFKNAFATTPICAASRASILTGLHERTHGYTFQKPRLQKPYAQIMYPGILKQNGYHVGFFGKLGLIIDSAGEYFNQSEFYDRSTYPDKRGYFYKIIDKDTVHLTRYTGQKAIEFIQSAPLDKPFCLSLSFSAPHAHDNGPEQYYYQEKSKHLYDNISIPKPQISEDEYFERLPKEVQVGFNRVRWKWRFDSSEKYQQMVKGYYRMITEIDDEIGNIRNLLNEKGIADNTIIIVMGDNGYFLGERQLADKWLMYDMSIRIPLIIYDPRKIMPSVVQSIAVNIDIPSTILDLAGIKTPNNYQGRSLKPHINNLKYSSKRKSILIEHLWPIKDIPSSEGVRTEKWKYFRYRNINAPEELYDLINDPLEINNLSKSSEYKSVLQKMRKTFQRKSVKYKNEKLCPDDAFQTEINF